MGKISLDDVFTYLGSAVYTDKGLNKKDIMPVNRTVSEDDIRLMKERPYGCDCCGILRDRKGVFFLKANMNVKVNGKGYEKGKVYQFGSSCIGRLLGPKNFKLAGGYKEDRYLPDGTKLSGRKRKVKRGSEFGF